MLSHGWPSPTSSGDGVGKEEVKSVTEEKDGRRLGTHQEYVISVIWNLKLQSQDAEARLTGIPAGKAQCPNTRKAVTLCGDSSQSCLHRPLES